MKDDEITNFISNELLITSSIIFIKNKNFFIDYLYMRLKK